MRVMRVVVGILGCVLTSSALLATDLPPDLCSLLTQEQIAKTVGQPFSAPEKTTAPPPYKANPPGTQCEYHAQKGPAIKVVFIAYVDPTTELAKQTFDRLAMFYRPVSKPAVGDSAYLDAKGAIHVLKNRVRYFIAIESAETSKSAPYTAWASGSSAAEPTQVKQVKELATAVAGKI